MRAFYLIPLAIFLFSSCINNNKSKNLSLSNTDSNLVKERKESFNNNQITKEPEKKTQKNCNVDISKSYTDWDADPGSGDMGGKLWIDFIKQVDGNYEAKIVQRFGTEGLSYPKQKVNDLFIDGKGNITFSVKWFTDLYGDKTKTKTVMAKGLITKKVLKFKIDISKSDEIILNSSIIN